jgi:hypothetical protein
MLLRHSVSGFRSAVSALHRWGVQMGEAPLRSSLSPKIEDPSQAEWGIKGADEPASVEGVSHKVDVMNQLDQAGG